MNEHGRWRKGLRANAQHEFSGRKGPSTGRPERRPAMGIAISLQQYLDGRGVPYDVMTHERAMGAQATAHASSIPEDNLAKGVLMRREEGYLLAIVPASRRVELKALEQWLQQPISLASEVEASTIFGDCELGSIPPVAAPYDLTAVMDDSLEGFKDIYFDGGDHCTLVHLTGPNFHRLMADVPHAHISERP
jgi:Ala-tRNA(Pro) deacylase